MHLVFFSTQQMRGRCISLRGLQPHPQRLQKSLPIREGHSEVHGVSLEKVSMVQNEFPLQNANPCCCLWRRDNDHKVLILRQDPCTFFQWNCLFWHDLILIRPLGHHAVSCAPQGTVTPEPFPQRGLLFSSKLSLLWRARFGRWCLLLHEGLSENWVGTGWWLPIATVFHVQRSSILQELHSGIQLGVSEGHGKGRLSSKIWLVHWASLCNEPICADFIALVGSYKEWCLAVIIQSIHLQASFHQDLAKSLWPASVACRGKHEGLSMIVHLLQIRRFGNLHGFLVRPCGKDSKSFFSGSWEPQPAHPWSNPLRFANTFEKNTERHLGELIRLRTFIGSLPSCSSSACSENGGCKGWAWFSKFWFCFVFLLVFVFYVLVFPGWKSRSWNAFHGGLPKYLQPKLSVTLAVLIGSYRCLYLLLLAWILLFAPRLFPQQNESECSKAGL